MIKALLIKEWYKIRYIWWLPLVVSCAALCDYYWTVLAVRSMHGAINLWAGFILKEIIYFQSLKWAFIFSGIWLACFQLLPECTGRKLRVFFHIPVDYRLAFFVIFAFGIGLLTLLFLIIFTLFWVINSHFGFPYELSFPMLKTLIPWALAGMVAWCVTASVIADPSFIRKIVLAGIGIGYMTLLTAEQGYAPMDNSFWGYFLMCLPWLFALPSSALRVKEGR